MRDLISLTPRVVLTLLLLAKLVLAHDDFPLCPFLTDVIFGHLCSQLHFQLLVVLFRFLSTSYGHFLSPYVRSSLVLTCVLCTSRL